MRSFWAIIFEAVSEILVLKYTLPDLTILPGRLWGGLYSLAVQVLFGGQGWPKGFLRYDPWILECWYYIIHIPFLILRYNDLNILVIHALVQSCSYPRNRSGGPQSFWGATIVLACHNRSGVNNRSEWTIVLGVNKHMWCKMFWTFQFSRRIGLQARMGNVEKN